MAKTKSELLEQAVSLGLELTDKNTVAEITKAIEDAQSTSTTDAKTAKAGKRSVKGIKEAEEKAEKTEAQKHRDESQSNSENDKPKQPQKVTSKLDRRAKGYRKANEAIETGKIYSLSEAIDTVIITSYVKFDATVELHVNLGVDPRQADQNLRDTVVLPAGNGKNIRISVFAESDDAELAKKAGADFAGNDELLQQLDKGKFDFDVLISTPMMMAKLGKYAKVLGPKGLMPNPKSGTVTTDVAKAVSEAKAGRVEYRVDSTGIVHLGVGKVSFGKDKLTQNIKAVFGSIKSNKPSTLKSAYVQSIHLTSTMGPSVKVDSQEI